MSMGEVARAEEELAREEIGITGYSSEVNAILTAGTKLGIHVVGVSGDIPERGTTKILIYGASGVGKTRLAATAAFVTEWQPAVLIDPEYGWASLEAIDFGDRLHRIPCKSPGEFESLQRGINSGKLGYRAAIIDGAGELYRLKMAEVLAKQGSTVSGIDMPELQHWGECTQWLRRVLRNYLYHTVGLKCVIVTTGEQLYKDDAAGMMLVGPALTGKLAGEVGHLFDLIIHLSVKVDPNDRMKLVRVAQLQPDRRVTAKDRWDIFGPEVESPDLTTMWAKRTEQIEKLRGQKEVVS